MKTPFILDPRTSPTWIENLTSGIDYRILISRKGDALHVVDSSAFTDRKDLENRKIVINLLDKNTKEIAFLAVVTVHLIESCQVRLPTQLPITGKGPFILQWAMLPEEKDLPWF